MHRRVVLGGVRRNVTVVMHGLMVVILVVRVMPWSPSSPAAAPSSTLSRSRGHVGRDSGGRTSYLHALPSRQMTIVHPAGLGWGVVWVPVHRLDWHSEIKQSTGYSFGLCAWGSVDGVAGSRSFQSVRAAEGSRWCQLSREVGSRQPLGFVFCSRHDWANSRVSSVPCQVTVVK